MLGVAACGGDDGKSETTTVGPLSGAALARAAGAVCREHRAFHPATSTKVPFDTFRELKQPYAADERRAQATYEELKALEVAPSSRTAFKNLYDTVGVIAAFDAAVVASTNVAEFVAVTPRIVRAYEVALKHAAEIGTADCPPRPASPAYLVAQAHRSGANKEDVITTPTTSIETTTSGTDDRGTAVDATSVLGQWRDVVTQYGPGSQRARYTTELDLTSVTIGQDGGTSSYPRFNCEGVLTVSSANADGSVVTYREDIVKGRKRCYDVDARIRVERRGGHFVSYRWRGKTAKGSRVEVLGELGEVGVPG